MPQFPRRSQQPLRPDSIRAAVRKLRQRLDRIERYAEATEGHDRAQLSRTIYGLSYAARDLSRRYRGMSVAQLVEEEERGAEIGHEDR